VNDPAPAAILHLRGEDTRKAHATREIQFENVVPRVIGDFVDRLRCIRASVIHENINPAHARQNCLCQSVDLSPICHISRDPFDAYIQSGGDASRSLFQSFLVPAADGYIRASRRKCAGHCGTETFAASCY
jgi:hypothetical protein